MTVQQHIAAVMSEFRRLSASRKNTLRREAIRHCQQYPHMADTNGFWRSLSARHVIEAAAIADNRFGGPNYDHNSTPDGV